MLDNCELSLKRDDTTDNFVDITAGNWHYKKLYIDEDGAGQIFDSASFFIHKQSFYMQYFYCNLLTKNL